MGGQSRTLVALWTVSDWVASFFGVSVTVDGCERNLSKLGATQVYLIRKNTYKPRDFVSCKKHI